MSIRVDRRCDAEGRRRLTAITAASSQPLGSPWDAMTPFDVDGLHLLAFEDGVPRVIESSLTHPATPRKRWDLEGCQRPLRVILERVWLGHEWKGGDRVVALCDTDSGSRVFVIRRTSGDAPAMIDLAGLHPTTLSLSAVRGDVWLWDPAGTLMAVDPETRRQLGQWDLGPSHEGAGLIAFPHEDALLLGGPAPGEVTLISAIAGGLHRCAVDNGR